jgi:hypothetical protein
MVEEPQSQARGSQLFELQFGLILELLVKMLSDLLSMELSELPSVLLFQSLF